MSCAHEFRTRHEHTEYVLMPEQSGHRSNRSGRRAPGRLKGCGTPSGVQGCARLPVANRYNHHLVDDSRAWRGANATLRSGSEDGSEKRKEGGGSPHQ